MPAVTPTPRAPEPAGPAQPSGRLGWVDVAKGACIVAVVALHVTVKHLAHLRDVDPGVLETWRTVCRALRPIRMPLFFVISGFLAARALDRRDPREIARRAWRSYELYLVWMVLHTVVNRRYRPQSRSNSLEGFLESLVLPTSNLWYLWALGTYLVVLALTPHRARPVAALVLAGIWLAIAGGWWEFADPRPRDLLQYVAAFALGAWAPAAITWVSTRAAATRISLLSIAVGGFTVASLVVGHTRDRPLGPLTIPVLQLLGLAIAVAASARLLVVAARRPVPGLGVLAYLGRHTLAIYVMHVPLLTVWGHVVYSTSWRGELPFVLGMLYATSLTAALVALPLGIEVLLRRAGAGRLFGDRKPRTDHSQGSKSPSNSSEPPVTRP